jgi:hypothetical protein
LVSFIARMTTITNSACRRVLVFWKTDLRQVRAVSYVIPSAFAQDRSDFPVIRQATRCASAGVKSNLSLRNAETAATSMAGKLSQPCSADQTVDRTSLPSRSGPVPTCANFLDSRTPDWLKMKKSAAPAVKRWGKR